jgi:uncharacterized cupredoxin-like copper-binding protein
VTVMRLTRSVAMIALVMMAGACSDSGGDGTPVTIRDFSIQVSQTSLPVGSTTFSVTNEGPSTHEFEVISVPEGLDPNALPTANNAVETGGGGLEVVDEVEDIAPSTSVDLTVSLEAGTYALICNLPGHYEQGMHVAVTVG